MISVVLMTEIHGESGWAVWMYLLSRTALPARHYAVFSQLLQGQLSLLNVHCLIALCLLCHCSMYLLMKGFECLHFLLLCNFMEEFSWTLVRSSIMQETVNFIVKPKFLFLLPEHFCYFHSTGKAAENILAMLAFVRLHQNLNSLVTIALPWRREINRVRVNEFFLMLYNYYSNYIVSCFFSTYAWQYTLTEKCGFPTLTLSWPSQSWAESIWVVNVRCVRNWTLWWPSEWVCCVTVSVCVCVFSRVWSGRSKRPSTTVRHVVVISVRTVSSVSMTVFSQHSANCLLATRSADEPTDVLTFYVPLTRYGQTVVITAS